MKQKHIFFIILLLIMVGCAKPDYYKSKGVHYFTKPAKELLSYYPFTYPPTSNLMGDSPIVVDSSLVLPTFTSTKGMANFYSTIYSFAIKDHAIQDSLVIPVKHISRACYANDLYLIGKEGKGDGDTLIIITTDKKLKQKAVHTYQLDPQSNLKEASIFEGNLYLLFINDVQKSYLSINLKTMKIVRKASLPGNVATAVFDNGFIYYVEKDTLNLQYVKQSLLDEKAQPIKNIISYQIKSHLKSSNVGYKLSVFGDYMTFSYHKIMDFDNSIGEINVVLINHVNNTFVAKTIEGANWNFIFDNKNLYAFKSVFRPSYKKYTKYLVLTVTKMDKNLNSEKELITFFPREWNYAFNMIMEDRDNVALIGTYMYQKNKYNTSIFLAKFNMRE